MKLDSIPDQEIPKFYEYAAKRLNINPEDVEELVNLKRSGISKKEFYLKLSLMQIRFLNQTTQGE